MSAQGLVMPLANAPSKEIGALVDEHMLKVHRSGTGKKKGVYDERSAHVLFLSELERQKQELKFPVDVPASQ